VTLAKGLLFFALATPLAMLLACVSQRVRDRVPSLLAAAPAPALAAALLAPAGTSLVLPEPPFRMTLLLDVPGAVLLGVAALLWISAGAYASAYLRDDPNAGRFAEWWLLTLTGNLGVFMAADLISFYLTYSVVSLAAYGLIVHDGTGSSLRAGIIYVALAVLGEALLLMAFVFLAVAVDGSSLLIRDAVAALPNSPRRDTAMALLILGFGLKIGLAPLHVWMPLAYTATPIPAAAVLSGAAVKAGLIGFIRFLPFSVAMPGWGEALAVAGIFSAFYGVLVGITQPNPKTVLAYSSISQMGLLAAALGMGLAAGDPDTALGAGFSGMHHVLVKGGLFLAVGASAATGPRLWPVLIPTAVLALSLGGLPFTGGMLAKLAVKAQLGEGLVGTLATLAAIGSTLLMVHFLRSLMQTSPRGAVTATPAGLVRSWLIIAFAAVAVPWVLSPTTVRGSLLAALAPGTLWAALWPVLIGGVLAIGLRRWRSRLPRVPIGDVVVVGETSIRAIITWGKIIERADQYLRQWSVACLLLLTFLVILGTTMLAWG
jgi:formate hydrogenlyase subunit 3/multisubunit Na+/H+ antiporter MnhD subunit